MAVWKKIGRLVSSQGTTITYQLEGTDLTVESRKRHIPHANGIGTWDATTYMVLDDGVQIRERYTLRDAKALAEDIAETQREMGVI